MTRMASRAVGAPVQVARIVAKEGTGTGLGGGSGLGVGVGEGVGVGVGLASSDGVGVGFVAVPPLPHPASANNKETATTPSLTADPNGGATLDVTRDPLGDGTAPTIPPVGRT